MNSIYNKYSSNIIEDDLEEVNPVSDLNFNSPNNFTTFKLEHGDSFYNGGIRYKITGKLVKKSDGSDYPAKSTIKLVDNFPAFLFSRIDVRKHGTPIASVEHVGVTSTVKGLVSYSSCIKGRLSSCGFESKYKSGGGKFEVNGKLGHLGLGFFDHLKYPMFKGGFEIVFIRAEDNDAIFHWKGTETGATEPVDGKVVIESFVLRVPIVEYDPESKIKLINELKTLSDSGGLVYSYYQWQCIEKKGIVGSSFSFDITNLFTNVTNPKFIMIALQRDRLNLQSADPSKFDSENIRNAVVKINQKRYPKELMNLDILSEKYGVLYDMYLNFRRVHFGDENVYMSDSTLIKDYPIIVVNTSRHPTIIDDSKNRIQIDLDFVNPIAAATDKSGTIAYVIVVSPTSFEYDITSNRIRIK